MVNNDHYTNRKIIIDKENPSDQRKHRLLNDSSKGRHVDLFRRFRFFNENKIGKNLQPHVNSEDNNIGWTVFLALFILSSILFIWYSKKNEIFRNEEAVKLHLTLERRVNKIDLLILRQDYIRALTMAGTLIHPHHELYKAKSEGGIDLSKGDLFADQVYFDTYWDHVRDSVKTVIKLKLTNTSD